MNKLNILFSTYTAMTHQQFLFKFFENPN